MKTLTVLAFGWLSLGILSCGDDAARAVTDGNGKNVDGIEAQAVDTQITSGPEGVVAERIATYEFSCNLDACTYECRVGDSDWQACTSPHQTAELNDGAYRFGVRAINAAGEADPTPAERDWTIDATEPETVIQTGPETRANASGARFTFGCNEVCGFECSLDGGVWSACTSPITYRQLEHGARSFSVRARDVAGNYDSAPSVWEWTVDLSGAHWVSIPAGTFLMGNYPDRITEEVPVLLVKGWTNTQINNYLYKEYPHFVTLTSDFEAYAYPVTNGEYEACVTAGDCTQPHTTAATYGYGVSTGIAADRPVTYVNWDQANAFCAWRGGRLPTEAEWEYFARGGEEGLRFANENVIDCDSANYSTSDSWFYDVDPQGAVACVGDTTAVGAYPANGYGVYDVVGNINEWVHDWFDANYFLNDSPTNDPQGPSSGTSRSVRGGGYASSALSVRISARAAGSPANQGLIGFRCVR